MIVLACEGATEIELIRSLRNKGQLTFQDEILFDDAMRIRQLIDVKYAINLLPIDTDITVYRIGDTLNDKFSLKGFEARRSRIRVFDVCTMTEIEILVIINEGLYQEYEKVKSEIRPKQFVKRHLKGWNPKEYFEENNMINALKEYKRLKGKTHGRLQYCLYDLISHKI